MNIVLTGYMASGKTTVGKRLAELLNRPFADTDAMVEEKACMKIAEIFDKYGEKHFRMLEKAAVLEISQKDGFVVATGGGVVLDSENVSNLRKKGAVINLFPDDMVVYTRLKNDLTRPLVRLEDMSAILKRFEERKPYYNDCDFQVRITRDTDAEYICSKIIEFLGDRL